MTKSKMANRYSPEVRARAVRMVFEHQGAGLFVYDHAALHGLISMRLQLNEEAGGRADFWQRADHAEQPILRSNWMG